LQNTDTLNISDEKDLSFKELNLRFNEITDIVRQAKIEQESEKNYFKYTLEHLKVGVLAYNETGEIELYNKAGKHLLNRPVLSNISELKSSNPKLAGTIEKLRINEYKLLKIKTKDEVIQLSLRAGKFKIRNRNIKLISFQNIKNELEENELDSWQKLIRVLAHEIMNSIGPISSMANTLSGLFRSKDKTKTVSEISQRIISETVTGLNIIERRGKGLINFVNNYRNIAVPPKLQLKKIQLGLFFKNIETFFKNEFELFNINFVKKVEPENLELTADEKLVEQIIINLIKNSLEAVRENKNPKLTLSASLEENGNIVISLTDNGKGIPNDIIDKIFIPFFTTKHKGSGIGLSLARQIMRLHGGTISANSEPLVKTVFSLRF
jgi:nitrogen fixation/metabolism regulation signal transduction histidine kinase